MMKIKVTAFLLAISLTLTLFTGCASKEESSSQPQTIQESSSTGTSDNQSDDTGNSIGDFSTVDTDGNTVTKDIFSGHKVTLVNIWATWCGWCLKEMPDLQAISEEMADDGLQVIGLVTDAGMPGQIDEDQMALVKEIMEKTGVTYTNIVQDEVLLNGVLSQVVGFPATFFVDEDGNILSTAHTGYQTKEQWLETIAQAMEEVEAQ